MDGRSAGHAHHPLTSGIEGIEGIEQTGISQNRPIEGCEGFTYLLRGEGWPLSGARTLITTAVETDDVPTVPVRFLVRRVPDSEWSIPVGE